MVSRGSRALDGMGVCAMTNDLEKFDPSKLMNGVRDRIKATFVSLIPDAQWEQLVQAEADKFFKPFVERPYHDRTKELFSDFQLVCLSVMQEIGKEKMKEYLAKYENNIWSGNEVKVNDHLKQLLTEHASDILAGLIGHRVQQVVNDMKNRGY
jgi:hypothetical protein